jgi:hypothetical protein
MLNDPLASSSPGEGNAAPCAFHPATEIRRAPRPAAPARERVAIVVAGMHRSGTSLLARLLTTLGAHLPEDRIGPGAGNPFGHWEPRNVVELNNRILAACDRQAIDPRPMPAGWVAAARRDGAVRAISDRIAQDYAGAAVLLLKDPRICRLLPLYAEALARLDIEMRVILCLRHPMEVAQSLVARDGLSPGMAALAWLRHVLEAEAHSRGCRRAWVGYADLVADCEGTMGMTGRRLGFPWRAGIEWNSLYIRMLVQPEQRHWTALQEEVAWPEQPFLQHVWNLARAATAGDGPDDAGIWDDCRRRLHEFDLYNSHYDEHIRAFYNSSSWRATAALRFFGHLRNRVLRR